LNKIGKLWGLFSQRIKEIDYRINDETFLCKYIQVITKKHLNQIIHLKNEQA
jgi:hypothetical protein